MRGANSDESTQALVDDLVRTTIAYLKQETIGQLSGLRKLAVLRLVAAICFAFGGVLLVIAAVRAVQTQTGTALSGSLSWLPYLFGLILATSVAAVLAWLTIRAPRARTPGNNNNQSGGDLREHMAEGPSEHMAEGPSDHQAEGPSDHQKETISS